MRPPDEHLAALVAARREAVGLRVEDPADLPALVGVLEELLSALKRVGCQTAAAGRVDAA